MALAAYSAVGLAAAQTAVNATDLAAQLKASPTFAYLKCLDAITSVHDQYKNTSDFSLVREPFLGWLDSPSAVGTGSWADLLNF